MSEGPYWFEEVPEEERYWFLAPWGVSPVQQAEREARREELEVSREDGAELRNTESDVRLARVFGMTEDRARKLREEVAGINKRIELARYGERALDGHRWGAVWSYEHKEEYATKYVSAPILYTSKERAEDEARRAGDDAPEGYLQVVEEYGQEAADDAFDNYVPYKALWVDRDTLLDKLRDATFLCVMMDDTLRPRQDLIEELDEDA